jgi:hypothetical protein
MTSRGTGRFIIPKGWPMKNHSDPFAAAREARQEAGLIGEIRRKPIGHYIYWKRLIEGRCLCSVCCAAASGLVGAASSTNDVALSRRCRALGRGTGFGDAYPQIRNDALLNSYRGRITGLR